jgi:hypothetical protein
MLQGGTGLDWLAAQPNKQMKFSIPQTLSLSLPASLPPCLLFLLLSVVFQAWVGGGDQPV